MLTRRYCLAINKGYRWQSTRRSYSTKQSDNDSIFSPTQSPWDHVFNDIDQTSPVTPTYRPRFSARPMSLPVSRVKKRRQTMTASEISKFEEMFRMIFESVNAETHRPSEFSKDNIQIGLFRKPGTIFGSKTQQDVNDLFGTLRRHSRNIKWTTASDEDFDRKKEEMELCDTDQQLLEWAMREVFGESRKYEEAVRNAIEKIAKGETVETMPMLQHPAYPHLISALMSTFREKYHDPHLSLSIFNYAQHLSIPSYVFGCTAPAYDELIETRWTCFRDLPGILEALEEMKVNGVRPDSRTRKLVETIRREAGQKSLWEHDDPFASGSHILDLLNRIDAMLSKRKPQTIPKKLLSPTKPTTSWDTWKSEFKTETEDEDDDWEFGKWERIMRR